MKLTLVRHAQTHWNHKKILQGGGSDIELDDTGIEQAKKVANRLKEHNFDMIITSPLIRAKQTANHINTHHNMDLIEEKRLLERIYGKLEGSDYEKLMENMQKIHLEDAYEIYEIERIEDLEKRVNEFIEELKKEHFGKNILIVSHSGTIKMILHLILKMPFTEIREKFEHSNTSVSTIEFDENKGVKEYCIADSCHLIE